MPRHRKPPSRLSRVLLVTGVLAAGIVALAVLGVSASHGQAVWLAEVQPLGAKSRPAWPLRGLDSPAKYTPPVMTSPLRPTRAPQRPDLAMSSPGPVATRALDAAMSLRGVPYMWGGTSRTGVDCSGLIVYAYRQAGIELPRTAAGQATAGRAVSLSELRPGDLLTYYSPVSHVVMFAGDGQVIEVSVPGTTVRVRPMYLAGFAAARRIAG